MASRSSGGRRKRDALTGRFVVDLDPATEERERDPVTGMAERLAKVAETLAGHRHVHGGCSCGWLMTAADFGRWTEAHREHVAQALAPLLAEWQAEDEAQAEAQAWHDNYDGMFARWAECDAERLRLKDELREANLRLRIAAMDAALAEADQ